MAWVTIWASSMAATAGASQPATRERRVIDGKFLFLTLGFFCRKRDWIAMLLFRNDSSMEVRNVGSGECEKEELREYVKKMFRRVADYECSVKFLKFKMANQVIEIFSYCRENDDK